MRRLAHPKCFAVYLQSAVPWWCSNSGTDWCDLSLHTHGLRAETLNTNAVQMWAWNKVAVLQKVLKETPPERAPWILYMQPDTIIDDVAFTFPFEMYQDKHWVSVGNADSVMSGWASGEASQGHLGAESIHRAGP